jgi:hypothetical protein
MRVPKASLALVTVVAALAATAPAERASAQNRYQHGFGWFDFSTSMRAPQPNQSLPDISDAQMMQIDRGTIRPGNRERAGTPLRVRPRGGPPTMRPMGRRR